MSERVIEQDNMVKEYECDSWDDFTRAVRPLRVVKHPDQAGVNIAPHIIYRGHEDPNYRLSSTLERDILPIKQASKQGEPLEDLIDRNYGAQSFEKHCSGLLERFRAYAAGLDGVDANLDDEELWAVGRHFGLLSPYLDWSASPYVAAFFALGKFANNFKARTQFRIPQNSDAVVSVWGLQLWDDLEDDSFEVSSFIGRPSSRLRAQQAWFTRLSASNYVDVEAYLKSREKAHYLEKFNLNARASAEAFEQLNLMNINYLTLFPDATGAALHSNTDPQSLFWLRIVEESFGASIKN